jgi:hypothetical protein
MDAPFRCIGRSLTEGWGNWPQEWLVACAFPKHRAFVCAPPLIHAAQGQELIDLLNQERAEDGGREGGQPGSGTKGGYYRRVFHRSHPLRR